MWNLICGVMMHIESIDLTEALTGDGLSWVVAENAEIITIVLVCVKAGKCFFHVKSYMNIPTYHPFPLIKGPGRKVWQNDHGNIPRGRRNGHTMNRLGGPTIAKLGTLVPPLCQVVSETAPSAFSGVATWTAGNTPF